MKAVVFADVSSGGGLVCTDRHHSTLSDVELMAEARNFLISNNINTHDYPNFQLKISEVKSDEDDM